MARKAYQIIIIGGGPGGYTLALDCGRRGMSVALIDEKPVLGGTCLNVGCIPSKALLESSELFHRINTESADHGILLAGKASLDLKAMMKRKSDVVDKLTGGLAVLMKSRAVEVFTGLGRVTLPGSVLLEKGTNTTELTAPTIVLATGSLPAALPHIPFDGKLVLDSTDALSLTAVPKRLAVIGGGAVGLELGSVWSRLGSNVTIIEALDQIVPGADPQAAGVLSAALKKQGLSIRTGATVKDAAMGSRTVDLTIQDTKETKAETLTVDKVLVAVGRRASFDRALDVKPKLTEDGRFIQVKENFETSIEGLYAMGDVVGGPMLAHKAEEEAMILAAHLAGEPMPPWGGPIPGIVYTEPEMAWAGETEASLKAQGIPYQKGHFPFAANGRALAAGESDGFVKLVSSPGDLRLLGAVVVGHNASELITEAVSVMAMGGAAEDIALTVHGHPTRSEATKEAALSLVGRPLNRN